MLKIFSEIKARRTWNEVLLIVNEEPEKKHGVKPQLASSCALPKRRPTWEPVRPNGLDMEERPVSSGLEMEMPPPDFGKPVAFDVGKRKGCRLGAFKRSSPLVETQSLAKKPKIQNYGEKKKGSRTFSVLFGRPQTKKHKTWEDDGILEVTKNELILRGSNQGKVAAARNTGQVLNDGSVFSIGEKVVQIQEEM